VVPWGFRKQLKWIAQEYNNPPVLITESGYSDLQNEGLNDMGRVYYYTVREIISTRRKYSAFFFLTAQRNRGADLRAMSLPDSTDSSSRVRSPVQKRKKHSL
jgi:hypothetical protein